MPSSLGNKNKYHNHSLELPHDWGLSASAQDSAVSSSRCTTTDESIFRGRGVGTWWEEPYLARQCTTFHTALNKSLKKRGQNQNKQRQL